MRTVADVTAAERAGADAVGFVTAAASIRRVTPSEAEVLGANCSLERFLVTENETPQALLAAARAAGVTGVQPHGEHSRQAAQVALQAGLSVLYPITVVAGVDASAAPAGSIPILDGVHPGSGARFDQSLIAALDGPFVIAGGLTPGNIGEIRNELRPYGVDVSSGIESERGQKDARLMVQFVEALR